MTDTFGPGHQPPAPQGRPCAICGAPALRSVEHPITRKQRVKFGFGMLLLTIITVGIALIIWLILPRRNVVVSVDRYLECTACGARQT